MAYANPSSMDVTSLTGIFAYLNSVTGGWFSNLVLIGLYIIVIIGYYKARDSFEEALAVAGYFCFIVAMLFWAGNIITGVTLGVVIAVAIIGSLTLLTTS